MYKAFVLKVINYASKGYAKSLVIVPWDLVMCHTRATSSLPKQALSYGKSDICYSKRDKPVLKLSDAAKLPQEILPCDIEGPPSLLSRRRSVYLVVLL